MWHRGCIIVNATLPCHTTLNGSSSTGDAARHQYREGYRRCHQEVMKFLGRTAAAQPHMTARLWHQFYLNPLGTTSRDGHPSPGCVKVGTGLGTSAQGRPHAAPDGADPSHHMTKDNPIQPRPDPLMKMTVPQGPCVPNTVPSRPAPYAHVHWKKCLRPPSRTCFWRPW